MIKYILTILGLICVALGTIGMFLPVLPTTPFLLLAAWLFLKGNPRLRLWLINHPILGKFIHNYIEHKAIPLHAKYVIITTMWLTIGISVYLVNPIWLKILLICISTAVTIHIARFKTLNKK